MVYNKIVISGGGINGISIVGAIYKFFENNKVEDITDIIGVSVGSIIGFLIVLGYTKNEIKNIFLEIKLNEFMDYKIKRLINDWGLDNGNLNKKLLKAFLINKNFNQDITFKNLYDKTNKNLIVCGTNLTNERIDYFNYKTTPDMRVVDSIMISCCFPVIYTPIQYNKCLYVDGGVLASYPIEYFEDSSGNIDNVIGFVIDYIDNNVINNKINSIDNYFYTIFKIIYNKNENEKINKYKKNTVIINKNKLVKNIMNYKLSDENKLDLFYIGHESYINFIKSKEV